jgi:hypothetical protein
MSERNDSNEIPDARGPGANRAIRKPGGRRDRERTTHLASAPGDDDLSTCRRLGRGHRCPPLHRPVP